MKKIFIVDDSDFIRRIVKSTLEKAGYETHEAINGELALQALQSETGYDLLVSDINMPGISGLDLVSKIKQTTTNQAIKVIMLTTETKKEFLDRSVELGVDHWMVKPFKPDDLIQNIKNLIGDS